MAKIAFTDALRREYQHLFDTCRVRPERQAAVDQQVRAIVDNRARYEKVSRPTGIPWAFIGAVHNMESSLRFTRHLHNGDPLTARTVQVPAGRPKTGSPPFTWEDSARDALSLRALDGSKDWSLPGLLYELEGYNGWGYRLYHSHVKSPYLWGFSNHYTSGKYVQDGTWSDTAASQQCGAAVLLRRMAERGVIDFPDQPAPRPGDQPLVVRFMKSKAADADTVAAAVRLQHWLNTHAGIFVKTDGWAGAATSDAFRKVTGHYLPGDPRES